MEWIQGNWLWLLLGLGVVWFLFRGGGCGMGGMMGSPIGWGLVLILVVIGLLLYLYGAS
ncbi:MAG TPA: hypothetical protein VJB14_14535 [Planctomycetota bacterium]|nr:hypothetical protein [Planctomycetota bacterium]